MTQLPREHIDHAYLLKLEEEKYKSRFFGEWFTPEKTASLATEFSRSDPFKYVVIDDFLAPELAAKIHDVFPSVDNQWHCYHNPIEVKHAFDDINSLPQDIKDVFYILSTQEVRSKISAITGIEEIEYDPFLHGAGLHSHGNGGRLQMHLDYEKHPFTSRERRLNIILYLTKEWKDEYNGSIELWNKTMTECVAKPGLKFNRAVLFQTNDISWHGLPDRIACPENVTRKSLAFYYVSPLSEIVSNKKNIRLKAMFTRRPSDTLLLTPEENAKMDQLYEIRKYRRISDADLEEIWPEWTPELY